MIVTVRQSRSGATALAALVALVASLLVGPTAALATEDPAFHMFDNGRLRFGGGGHDTSEPAAREDSVNALGNLQQPFYWSTADSKWYKLTYWSYPLDVAVGTGTGGAQWHGNTAIASSDERGVDPVLDLQNQQVDSTGFVPAETVDGGVRGHGTLASTGTAEVGGQAVEIASTYTLGETDAFVAITTTVTNVSGSQADNVNLWVGTRDDWVGNADGPTKERGRIVDGAFVAAEEQGESADALRITSGNEGVLFYSTTAGANAALSNCCSFSNAYNQDPATSASTETGDGSYSMVLPAGDLADGESATIEWYYAASDLDTLDDVVEDVSDVAQPAVPEVETGNRRATVRWEEPAADGEIVDYVIRYSADGGTTWTEEVRGSADAPLEHTIEGLANGTSYVFAVAAVTGEATGEFSVPSAPAAPGLPVNVTAPAIAGTPVTGVESSVDEADGDWVNHGDEPLEASYQWQADGSDVAGATDATFTPTAEQAGAVLRAVVTRTNEVGSVSVTTPESAPVVDATLASLALDGVEIAPGFDPDVTGYAGEVAHEVDEVGVTATATLPAATVTVGGAAVDGDETRVDLAVGANEIPVTVTLGGQSLIYTVVVTRAAAEPAPEPDPEPLPGADGALQRPSAGNAASTVGGRRADVTVDRTAGGTTVSGEGYRMTLSPGGAPAAGGGGDDVTPASGTLRLHRGQEARVEVDGFAADSPVELWMFSEPSLLGEFTTDADGALDEAGATIPADVATGAHTLQAEGTLPDGREVAVALGIEVGVAPVVLDEVTRLSGSDRIRTAIEVSRQQFPDAGDAEAVFLARHDDYADALAAGPLAFARNAPILLTPSGELPAPVVAEIERLGVDEVTLLGGDTAITADVERTLADTVGSVDRLAGGDRFATATAIAHGLAAVTGDEPMAAYLTRGRGGEAFDGWADAVAVSALAAAQGRPILLVDGHQLPEATAAGLRDLDVADATVVGGSRAVSDAVAREVDAIVGGLDRLRGGDRYGTSAAIAARAVDAGLDPDRAWLATGRDWPDSIVGGPAVARQGGVLLLVDGDDPSASAVTTDWLAGAARERLHLSVLGGQTVVADDALIRLPNLVSGG